MVTIPAWEAWSMKARGGYNTSFFFSAWLLYLLVMGIRSGVRNGWGYFLLGLICSVIFAAHPIWIPGMVPFVGYLVWKEKALRGSLMIIAGFAAGYIIIFLLSLISPNINYWHPPLFGWSLYAIADIPKHIYNTIHGSKTLFEYKDVGLFTDISAWLWMGALVIFLAIQVYRIITKRYLLFSHLFAISIFFTAGYLVFLHMEGFNPRHLLPIAQFIAGGVAVELAYFYTKLQKYRVVPAAAALSLILSGAASAYDFRNIDEVMASLAPGHTRLGDMKDFVTELTGRNIHCFYAINALAEWDIIFLSNEQLIGQATNPTDRYPPYVAEINKSISAGKPFAITGADWQMEKYVKKNVTDKQFHSGVCSCSDLCAVIVSDTAIWNKVKSQL